MGVVKQTGSDAVVMFEIPIHDEDMKGRKADDWLVAVVLYEDNRGELAAGTQINLRRVRQEPGPIRKLLIMLLSFLAQAIVENERDMDMVAHVAAMDKKPGGKRDS